MRVNSLKSRTYYCAVTDRLAAHIIRRHVTTFNRAATELKACTRWCLTGTPIQNKLEDLGALLAFIRASPFHNLGMFRKFVTLPFDESEEHRVVATQNLTLLMDALCLRRARDLLKLPDPQERVIVLEFSKEERDLYQETMQIMNRALRYKPGESHGKKIFGLFQIQLQLRILCNHGTYQHPFSWKRQSLLDEREAALCLVGSDREVVCSVCSQPVPILDANRAYQRVTGNCAHVLCSDCLDEDEELHEGKGEEVVNCPLCTLSGVQVPGSRPGALGADNDDAYLRPEGHSSKMEALVSDIKKDLWQSKRSVIPDAFPHRIY
jgi:SWI/SNF-related matrix-associated actin-dependent regulator of chromatin subfamily A3